MGHKLVISSGKYEKPFADIIGYYADDEGYLQSSAWSAQTHMNNMSKVTTFWFRLNQYDPTDLEEDRGLMTSVFFEDIIVSKYYNGIE